MSSEGKKVASLTIFSNHSERLEFLTSQGEAFARLSDRDGSAHLDLLSLDQKAGIFATATDALKIAAIRPNEREQMVVDDPGFLGAVYTHPATFSTLKVNMRGAVPITAADGTDVGLVDYGNRSLTSEDGVTQSFDIMIRLLGPSGGEWCYVKVHGGTFQPSDKTLQPVVQVPRYTIDLYDAHGFTRIEATYFLFGFPVGAPGLVNTKVFLSDPNDTSDFRQPQKPESINPESLTLVPGRIFPRGSFSWLSGPDAGFSPPLRLVDERGDTIAIHDEVKTQKFQH
ncbi:MAG: hypothetical protein ACYDD2_08055 [Candidatus Acidiferrales bacterium]